MQELSSLGMFHCSLPGVQFAIQKNRTGLLSYQQFLALPWLALKVLMPSRSYVFHENKPQLDYIFPKGLKGADDAYGPATGKSCVGEPNAEWHAKHHARERGGD